MDIKPPNNRNLINMPIEEMVQVHLDLLASNNDDNEAYKRLKEVEMKYGGFISVADYEDFIRPQALAHMAKPLATVEDFWAELNA